MFVADVEESEDILLMERAREAAVEVLMGGAYGSVDFGFIWDETE